MKKNVLVLDQFQLSCRLVDLINAEHQSELLKQVQILSIRTDRSMSRTRAIRLLIRSQIRKTPIIAYAIQPQQVFPQIWDIEYWQPWMSQYLYHTKVRNQFDEVSELDLPGVDEMRPA